MKQNDDTITIGKSDRIELDASSLSYYPEFGRKGPLMFRVDWGYDELMALGEEKRNGTLVFSEERLKSVLRAYLSDKIGMPVKSFRFTYDIYKANQGGNNV